MANTTPWPTRPNVKPAEAGCTSGDTDQSSTGNYQKPMNTLNGRYQWPGDSNTQN
nr:MAG TPA: hypothetical protein [Caudoviricetes sp.]DAR37560.1 MAG TPA: hypothetical protein [Caudoviricetes sp.]